MLCACEHQPNKPTDPKPTQTVTVPEFNADSAYAFVKAQTDFGPRVPNTEAHEQCAQWLVGKLSEYADTVMVQEFRTRLYMGKGIDGKNIIASFNPEAKKRLLLCAHWDSRPFADHDPDEAHWNHPIDGANDGASGVGVLLPKNLASISFSSTWKTTARDRISRNNTTTTDATTGLWVHNTGRRSHTSLAIRRRSASCLTWWVPASRAS